MDWKTDGPRSVPQAFPYQGSKRQLVGRIFSLFPDGGVAQLIEPFAGSAAIAVASRRYGLSRDVVISDVNEPLMDLWRMIVDQPVELLAQYERMWHEQIADPKTYFVEIRREFNETKRPELLLYLLARCVKASVRYTKDGNFNQSADNRRLGARPAAMTERIHSASRLMQGAKISNQSYEQPLTTAPVDALVYLDPPYQGTSHVPDHRYLAGLRREEFAEALGTAVDRGVSFIVSYDVVTDDDKYGEALPAELGLLHRHVVVGVSSQATLSGRNEVTVESLYVSPALVERLGGPDRLDARLDSQPSRRPALL